MRTSVLLLLFNRPQLAQEAFERIRSVQPPRLYVHIDGPRPDRPHEAALTAQCKAVLDGVDWPCEVFTLIRTENFGLRAGVYDAINWFFKSEPWGIIVEDDCLPDPSFFSFCEILLEQYANDERVMHIGGSNLAEQYLSEYPNSFVWSRFSLVWGWASWRRAWERMSLTLEGLDYFIEDNSIKYLLPNRMAQAYMLDKFQQTSRGANNSWAYAWFFSILKYNGLCIIPARNLIQNAGVGTEGATHTTKVDPRSQLKAGFMQFPLQYPDEQRPDLSFEQQVFYHTQKPQIRLWIWYFLHKIGLR